MKRTILLIISLLLSINLAAQKFSMEPECIVGSDEDDDYTFFKIRAIKFNNNGGFLVGDITRMSVSMYSKRGKFVKRVGSPGKGPQEFMVINGIGVGKNNIYVNDSVENKFLIYDNNLKFVKQMKVKGDPMKILKVYDDGSFMTSNYFASDSGHGRFVKLNPEGEIEYSFFNKCWWGDFRKGNKRDDFVKKMSLATVNSSCNNGRVIFGFQRSENPTDIFVNTNKGQNIKRIKYDFKDKKYGLDHSRFTFKGMRGYAKKLIRKEKIYIVKFSSGFIYKDYYLVFLKYIDLCVGANETDYNMFLVFDKSGKLLHEEDLCNDLTFYDLNNDGYLIGADLNADVVTVQIHKLTF